MKLYKYHKINEYSISSLLNGFCWASNPSEFNDPFDTKIIDNDFLCKINFSKEKIYCLSKVKDNLLMWSHYADSHKGFCLEFTDYLDSELTDLKAKSIYPKADNDKLSIVRNAKKVNYKSSTEIDEYVKDIPTDEKSFLVKFESLDKTQKRELENKIHSTTFIKHENWEYEQEYRLVNTERNIIKFPGKLTGVYFGMKMSAINKRMIGKTLNPDFKNNIKFYQMYREKGKYSLSSRLFNFDTDLEGFNEFIKYS